MADYLAFARRLKELIAAEDQMEVAAKLGYTQSRVSQMCRGEKPARAFVERLIEVYNLPREEWLALANLGRPAAVDDERLEIARRAAEETVTRLRAEGALRELTYELDPDSLEAAAFTGLRDLPDSRRDALLRQWLEDIRKGERGIAGEE